MDPRRTPGGILFCHDIGGCADLDADPSPARVGSARTKSPVQSKSWLAPTHDGLGFHHHNRIAPTIAKRRQRNPEQPVATFEMWARTLAFEHGDLLSQGKDLQTKIVAGAEKAADVGEECGCRMGHAPK
jgi:hypothetical protein